MRKVESWIFNKDYIVPEKHDAYAKAATLYRYTEDRKKRFYVKVLPVFEHIREHTLAWDIAISWSWSVVFLIWLFRHIRWR